MVGPRTGSAATRRILIVGDLALSRSTLRMVLSRLGYVVTCVGTAAEAGVALGHTRFALVMVALHLPDMQGLAFGRWLRQEAEPPSEVPVLLFGDAWDQPGVLNACHGAGLAGYLPKPISFGRLVATVNELTRPNAEETPLPLPNPPIELAHFTSFTDGDRQLERELASLYLATAEHYLRSMREALQGGGAWEHPAHSLKGASANIGAQLVATLAKEAEHAEPSAEMLGRIEPALASVRAFFNERCQMGEPANSD